MAQNRKKRISILCKYINFSIRSRSIQYSKLVLPLKHFLRDVKKENLCSKDLIKTRLHGTALTVTVWYKVLKHLTTNENITSLGENKGKNTKTIDKSYYIKRTEEESSYNAKLSKLDIPAGKKISRRNITLDPKLLKIEKFLRALFKQLHLDKVHLWATNKFIRKPRMRIDVQLCQAFLDFPTILEKSGYYI